MKTAHTVEAINWHLHTNIFPPLTAPTITRILEVCEELNTGNISLSDPIHKGQELGNNIVTVGQMLEDLQIETL